MTEEALYELGRLLEELDNDEWLTELDYYPHRLYGKGKFYHPEDADDRDQLAVITTVFRDFLSDQIILSVCFRYKLKAEPPSWCVYQELGDWEDFWLDEVHETATAERLKSIGRNCLQHFEDEINHRFPLDP